jgi:arginase family enzyme
MTHAVGFLDFDLATGEELSCAPVLLLGVPVDAGAKRGGCREAPDAIRRASAVLVCENANRGCDIGNLSIDENWRQPVRNFVLLSISQGSIPVLIGGGPEIASVALEAAEKLPVVAVTHVLRPGYTGRRMAWIGLNGPQPAQLWDAMVASSQAYLSAQQLDGGATVEYPDDAFLWIDAAVLDTGHAAGAADINPGGLAPDTLLKALAPLKKRVRGIVVTGAAPNRDPRGLTELVLASAIREVLGDA